MLQIALLVLLVAFTVAGPASAQDSAHPQGDVGEALAVASQMLREAEQLPDGEARLDELRRVTVELDRIAEFSPGTGLSALDGQSASLDGVEAETLAAEVAELRRALCQLEPTAECVLRLAVLAATEYWDQGIPTSLPPFVWTRLPMPVAEVRESWAEAVVTILMEMAELQPGFLASDENLSILSVFSAEGGRSREAFEFADRIADADHRVRAFDSLVSLLLHEVVYPDVERLSAYLDPVAGPEHDPAVVEEALTIINQSLARLGAEPVPQDSRRFAAILLAREGAVEDAVSQVLDIEDFREVAFALVRVAHPNVLGERPSALAAVAEASRVARDRVPILQSSTGPYEGLFYQHEAVLNLALTFARAGQEHEALALLQRIADSGASRYHLTRVFAAMSLISNDLLELERYAESLNSDIDRAELLAYISQELSRRGDQSSALTRADIALSIVERFAMSGELVPASTFIQLADALFEAEAVLLTLHALDLALSVDALDQYWDLHHLGVRAAEVGEATLAQAILSKSIDWFVEDGYDNGHNFADFMIFADLVDGMAAAAAGNHEGLLCAILMTAEQAIERSSNRLANGVVAHRLAEIQARMGNWQQSRDWATLSVRHAAEVSDPLDRLRLLALSTAFFVIDMPAYEAGASFGPTSGAGTETCPD